ncbi:DUF2987 domain-containing protein [Flavobacterium sp. W21_SRS_FM6]|uniref:DUF2987 domain-containing protein n=1 Tax=Flavobacterium sp. W21_SRS_FM6 TaxID=3240268 RepID=UPI003F8E462A
MKKLVLTFALLSQACFAEHIEVEYSRFYSHLKKIDKEELNALQFSFGFKKVQEEWLCDIDNAIIVTQKQTIPLVISKDKRFTLPTEKALKLADAYISVDIKQPANQCDMSVQLETKTEYLKVEYSQAELKMLSDQYATFFSDMGSFLSFMMPGTEGLRFSFEDTPGIENNVKGLALKNKEIDLHNDTIEHATDGLKLNIKPLRINALMSK